MNILHDAGYFALNDRAGCIMVEHLPRMYASEIGIDTIFKSDELLKHILRLPIPEGRASILASDRAERSRLPGRTGLPLRPVSLGAPA